MKFAERLRAARDDADITQTQLARRARTSQSRISSYEKGTVVPTESTQERLLKCARNPPAVMLDRRRDDVVAAAARNHLTNVRVFGSVARNEDTLTSDIDLLVTPASGALLFGLVGFADEVEAFLGYPVDVVSDLGTEPDSAIIREAQSLSGRQTKGAEEGRRFVLRDHPESRLVLADEDEKRASDEKKRAERLPKTLDAMKSSLDKADEFASLGRDRFDHDWIVQNAAVMVLTHIGEQVKRLPQTFTSARPDVEWTKIARMRDKLTHGYVGTDYDLVWDALVQDVPTVRAALSGPPAK